MWCIVMYTAFIYFLRKMFFMSKLICACIVDMDRKCRIEICAGGFSLIYLRNYSTSNSLVVIKWVNLREKKGIHDF